MKSGLFNLPKYIWGFKKECALCLINSPSRTLPEEVIRNWDKDLGERCLSQQFLQWQNIKQPQC